MSSIGRLSLVEKTSTWKRTLFARKWQDHCDSSVDEVEVILPLPKDCVVVPLAPDKSSLPTDSSLVSATSNQEEQLAGCCSACELQRRQACQRGWQKEEV